VGSGQQPVQVSTPISEDADHRVKCCKLLSCFWCGLFLPASASWIFFLAISEHSSVFQLSVLLSGSESVGQIMDMHTQLAGTAGSIYRKQRLIFFIPFFSSSFVGPVSEV